MPAPSTWPSPEERERLRRKFVEYKATHDRKTRNELIEAHRSLASHLARRFANRGEPFDDLLQVAYLGMLKAVERFEPDRGLEFSTFATATVEGELKRHFRDQAPGRSASRAAPRSCTCVSATRSTSCRNGSSDRRKLAELAEDLGVSEEHVLEAMEVGGAYRSASLDSKPERQRRVA